MNYWFLGLLLVLGFIQNMAFTASSRSRNSGDPLYHFRIAIFSNGIWFISNMFILKTVWEAIMNNNWSWIAVVGFTYVTATSAGSATMMKVMQKWEIGKRKVGA
jgi:hypothetical protein